MKKTHRVNQKRASLIAVAVMFGLGYAATSFGALTHNIKYTPHNLGSTGTGNLRAQTENEICIFCHTPHNSAPGQKFIWNKTNKVTTFQFYTASDTLDYDRTGIQLSDVSKMCMTCHDGAGGVNSMANPRPSVDPVLMQGGTWGDQIGDNLWGDPVWGANIGNAYIADPDVDTTPADGYSDYVGGGNLTNDHPVSFTYDANLVNNDGTLNSPSGGQIGGLPLWNGKVECVTCHDPHINYKDGTPGGDKAYRPFLRKTNQSSSLCFTCHNK